MGDWNAVVGQGKEYMFVQHYGIMDHEFKTQER